MPTLDFERERARFLGFHAEHEPQWRAEAAAYASQLRKFSRKYRAALEESGTPYEIRQYISDLIGVRVVCLYEDELEKVAAAVQSLFDVIDVTDKVTAVEGTEASFGYKGLHLDLRLNAAQCALPANALLAPWPIELQIRTIIQDSWSVLDHKIKYKKAIPGPLKRRINVLSALFELADREFRQIRDETETQLRKAPDETVEATADAEPLPTAPWPRRRAADSMLFLSSRLPRIFSATLLSRRTRWTVSWTTSMHGRPALPVRASTACCARTSAPSSATSSTSRNRTRTANSTPIP
jgi:putative GTP pyrophosphokinase